MANPDISLSPHHRQPSFRPVDIDHIYRDPDVELPVLLLATRSKDPKSTPRDTHWKLAWQVGMSPSGVAIRRQIHIIRDSGANHLTNWGPLTKSCEGYTKAVTLTIMPLEGRRLLEKIAHSTPILKVNGGWNSQDWLQDVLEASVRQGLVSSEERDVAVRAISDV